MQMSDRRCFYDSLHLRMNPFHTASGYKNNQNERRIVITVTNQTDLLFIEFGPQIHQGLVITFTGAK